MGGVKLARNPNFTWVQCPRCEKSQKKKIQRHFLFLFFRGLHAKWKWCMALVFCVFLYFIFHLTALWTIQFDLTCRPEHEERLTSRFILSFSLPLRRSRGAVPRPWLLLLSQRSPSAALLCCIRWRLIFQQWLVPQEKLWLSSPSLSLSLVTVCIKENVQFCYLKNVFVHHYYYF